MFNPQVRVLIEEAIKGDLKSFAEFQTHVLSKRKTLLASRSSGMACPSPEFIDDARTSLLENIALIAAALASPSWHNCPQSLLDTLIHNFIRLPSSEQQKRTLITRLSDAYAENQHPKFLYALIQTHRLIHSIGRDAFCRTLLDQCESDQSLQYKLAQGVFQYYFGTVAERLQAVGILKALHKQGSAEASYHLVEMNIVLEANELMRIRLGSESLAASFLQEASVNNQDQDNVLHYQHAIFSAKQLLQHDAKPSDAVWQYQARDVVSALAVSANLYCTPELLKMLATLCQLAANGVVYTGSNNEHPLMAKEGQDFADALQRLAADVERSTQALAQPESPAEDPVPTQPAPTQPAATQLTPLVMETTATRSGIITSTPTRPTASTQISQRAVALAAVMQRFQATMFAPKSLPSSTKTMTAPRRLDLGPCFKLFERNNVLRREMVDVFGEEAYWQQFADMLLGMDDAKMDDFLQGFYQSCFTVPYQLCIGEPAFVLGDCFLDVIKETVNKRQLIIDIVLKQPSLNSVNLNMLMMLTSMVISTPLSDDKVARYTMLLEEGMAFSIRPHYFWIAAQYLIAHLSDLPGREALVKQCAVLKNSGSVPASFGSLNTLMQICIAQKNDVIADLFDLVCNALQDIETTFCVTQLCEVLMLGNHFDGADAQTINSMVRTNLQTLSCTMEDYPLILPELVTQMALQVDAKAVPVQSISAIPMRTMVSFCSSATLSFFVKYYRAMEAENLFDQRYAAMAISLEDYQAMAFPSCQSMPDTSCTLNQ